MSTTEIVLSALSLAAILLAIFLRKQIDAERNENRVLTAANKKLTNELKYSEKCMEITSRNYEKEIEKLREMTEETATGVFGIKSIHFTAIKPDGTLHDTKFTLGLGPCGKTVEWLRWERNLSTCVLTQYHTDGSLKVFTYRDADMLGREVIEKEVLPLRKGSRAQRDLHASTREKFVLPSMR